MQKGFTIIELLVVIIIISVLTGIVVSTVTKINSQLSFSRVVNTFLQDAVRVEQLSLSSDRLGAALSVDGYGIYVDLSKNKQYVLYADKSPGNHHYDPQDQIVETVDFSQTDPGVIIEAIDNISGGQASVNFSPPNPTTTITPYSASHSVDIVFALQSDPAATRTVSINEAGLIEIK